MTLRAILRMGSKMSTCVTQKHSAVFAVYNHSDVRTPLCVQQDIMCTSRVRLAVTEVHAACLRMPTLPTPENTKNAQ